jgi:hypothetical protein
MRFLHALYTALMVILMVILLASASTVSRSQLLWYNGDFNGATAFINAKNSNDKDARIYDDFIVPAGETWHLTAVFSNDVMDFDTALYDWEIRQGVSAGDGGTLLYSGEGGEKRIATGRTFSGIPEYTLTVPVSLTLGEGTYWLMVRPVGTGTGSAYLTSTSGANAVGTPPGNDGNSFYTNPVNSTYFVPAIRVSGAGDFSMGILGGDPRDPTPEPGPLGIAIGAGLAGAMFIRQRIARR